MVDICHTLLACNKISVQDIYTIQERGKVFPRYIRHRDYYAILHVIAFIGMYTVKF